MLLISCPHCGPRSQVEFTYGGDATVVRPAADASAADWVDYVYLRDNPHGVHSERWHHSAGCRRWITLHRNVSTHEFVASS